MKNVKLAVEVLNHILDNPETWSQHEWLCGTTHCFAGRVQTMSGRPERVVFRLQDMADLLECGEEDASWLAYSRRTLSELHAYVAAYVNGTPYFDADGFGKDGFDRHNRGRDGNDREGYDREGYDRNGYDRHGYYRIPRLPRLTTE